MRCRLVRVLGAARVRVDGRRNGRELGLVRLAQRLRELRGRGLRWLRK